MAQQQNMNTQQLQNMMAQQNTTVQSGALQSSSNSSSEFQLKKLSSEENPFAPGGAFSIIKPNSLVSLAFDFSANSANAFAIDQPVNESIVNNTNIMSAPIESEKAFRSSAEMLRVDERAVCVR